MRRRVRSLHRGGQVRRIGHDLEPNPRLPASRDSPLPTLAEILIGRCPTSATRPAIEHCECSAIYMRFCVKFMTMMSPKA